MNLSSISDYVIAITGSIIIIGSFAWNIHEIFFKKSNDTSDTN